MNSETQVLHYRDKNIILKLKPSQMKRLLLLFPVLFLFSSFTTTELSNHPVAISTITGASLPEISEKNLQKIAALKIKDVEKLTGRKLKLKEKIAFKIYQLKLKKELKKKDKDEKPSKGQTAFILGLIGICSLVVPYVSIAALPLAILAVVIGSNAKKENPNDKKAQTGMILGIITLGLFALAILLVVALIGAYGGW